MAGIRKGRLGGGRLGASGNAKGALGGLSGMVLRSRLACADGLRVSAQASELVFCWPRANEGPYESVELGYPSREMPRWSRWAQDQSALTETVYASVPIGAVAYVIAECGGREGAQADWAEVDLMGKALTRAAPFHGGGGRLDMDAADREWESPCGGWVQAAALGSPAAEEAARFEVWRGNERMLDWSRCLACFLAAGFDAASGNDFTGWVRCMREVAHLEMSSKPGPKGPRRPAL